MKECEFIKGGHTFWLLALIERFHMTSRPIRHIGVPKILWELNFLLFQVKLEYENVGFWGEGKTGTPGEKTSRSKEENQQQSQPTNGVDTGIWATFVGGKSSHNCATLAQCGSFPYVKTFSLYSCWPHEWKRFVRLTFNVNVTRFWKSNTIFIERKKKKREKSLFFMKHKRFTINVDILSTS